MTASDDMAVAADASLISRPDSMDGNVLGSQAQAG